MAILVDELREYPDVRLPFTRWCHMASDRNFDELHAFAARLGLRRRWFQRDHYDLPAHARAAAVALGAEEVLAGELLERMAGPRGDRARRRGRTPSGVLRLRGPAAPAALRYPPGALVAVAGPRALAERIAGGVPLLEGGVPRDRLAAVLHDGRGAVALCPDDGGGLAEVATAVGVSAHLVLLGGQCAGSDPAPFASVVVADRAAAAGLRRLVLGAGVGA